MVQTSHQAKMARSFLSKSHLASGRNNHVQRKDIVDPCHPARVRVGLYDGAKNG
jgi:hypothetical protein